MNLDPLLHMLGLNEHQSWPTRNHYVTDATDPEIAPLIAAGLVEEARAPKFLAEGDHVFRATVEGNRVAVAERKRRYPPPSRSKARYLHWISVADAVGCSFGEWLKKGMYKPGYWS